MTDLILPDLVPADAICVDCGHTSEEHADELPSRCEAHGDVHPCECEAFVPGRNEAAEENAA